MNKIALLAAPLLSLAIALPAQAQDAKPAPATAAGSAVSPAGVQSMKRDDGRVDTRKEADKFYTETQTKKNFEAAAGNDGVLSQDEFTAWQKSLRDEAGYESPGVPIAKRFERADANNDGVVDLQEARRQKRLEMEHRRQAYDRIEERFNNDEMTRGEKLKEMIQNDPKAAAKFMEEHPDAMKYVAYKHPAAAEKFFATHPEARERFRKEHPNVAARLKDAPGVRDRMRDHPNAAAEIGKAAHEAGYNQSDKAMDAVQANPRAADRALDVGMKNPSAGKSALDKAVDNPGATKNAYGRAQNNKAAVKKAGQHPGAAKKAYQNRKGNN